MDMPPTRYRIVERGRRLEVIDTWTGEPAERPSAKRRTSPMLRRLGSGDGTRFTTSALYDAKGPRTLKLDYAATARLKRLRFAVAFGVAITVALAFWLWWAIPFAVLAVFNPRVREGIRAGITRYLDGFDQAAAAAPPSSG